MKRVLCLLICIVCVCGLCVPASARSNAEQMHCEASVGKDGSCDVTIRATLGFDETVSDPVFPIPLEASHVTLNGGAVNTGADSRAKLVSLSGVTGGAPGIYSVVITYQLDNAAEAEKDGQMLLELPILVGLAYPVDDLTVTVTLPDDVETEPEFLSGYYQQHTDKLLKTTVSGKTITIKSQQTLMDHETLTMTLKVDDSMFPGTAAAARVMGLMDLAVLLTAVLAIVYYSLTLRPAIPRKILRNVAPDGLSAGDVPQWLMGEGTDLSMLVVAWAQLGYLRIVVEPDGRVMLYKRMEMGNERSNFENRCFKNLFGRRRILDGTSDHYARMVRYAANKGRRGEEVYAGKYGNTRVFRVICTVSALLSGISLAGSMMPNSLWLRLLMTVVTALLAWYIQQGVRGIYLRDRLPLWIALGCVALWLVLGFAAGEWLMTLLMVLFQIAAGFAAAFGGIRTELGRLALSQMMGLRKFMCSASKPELVRLMKTNSGYFHEMAPYALALGVDGRFARGFGRLRLPECTYLTVSGRGQMTAAQWAAALRSAVETMDAKSKRLPLNKRADRRK